MTITVHHTFNGEAIRTTTHRGISTRLALSRLCRFRLPMAAGWGRTLEMDHETAVAMGAYETTYGEWVIRTPDLQETVSIRP